MSERNHDETLGLPYGRVRPFERVASTVLSTPRAARLRDATRVTRAATWRRVSHRSAVLLAVVVYGVLDTASTAAAQTWGPTLVNEASPLVFLFVASATKASLPLGTWLLLGLVKCVLAGVIADGLLRVSTASKPLILAAVAYSGWVVVTNLLLAAGWSM